MRKLDPETEFLCNDVFVLLRDCIVFCGEIRNGELRVGDEVAFQSDFGEIAGEIDTILNEASSQFVKAAVKRSKVRVGVVQIKPVRFQQLLHLDVDEEDQPSVFKLLGVSIPFLIHRSRGAI